MSPIEKIFKKEYAKELFRIAQSDLVAATVLSQNSEVRKETILFNVEQAVEKTLKAVICHQQKPVPFTHDLYSLLQKFDVQDLPPGGYALHDLTPFASIRRYEEGNYILTDHDIEQALNLAKSVLDWAKSILEK